MSMGFLLDEDLPGWWPKAILRRQAHLKVLRVGDVGAPPFKSLDPVILEWCEANDAYLLTNNRKTMPGHLADHVAQGRHVPGIFIVEPERNTDELADTLSLIEGAALPEEYRDQIRYLPPI